MEVVEKGQPEDSSVLSVDPVGDCGCLGLILVAIWVELDSVSVLIILVGVSVHVFALQPHVEGATRDVRILVDPTRTDRRY